MAFLFHVEYIRQAIWCEKIQRHHASPLPLGIKGFPLHIEGLLPPLVYRRMHVLFTLCVLVCAQCCPTHIVLCFCFVLLSLVYHMLPVSLDCPFVIVPSVFSNVYMSCVLCTICCQFLWIVHLWLSLRFSLTFICPVSCVPYVASFSGLSIFDCPFGFLYRLFVYM